MANKKQKEDVDKKIYTTSTPVQMHLAVQATDVEDARQEVYKVLSAMQLVLKCSVQLLTKPTMEEHDMKAANKPQEVEVEVDGE